MAQLESHHPGDRERSLFASVELSLRRLPAGLRETIRPLGVLQGGGGHRSVMARLCMFDFKKPELTEAVANALERTGLATQGEYGYVRFDPALIPLLLSEMDEAKKELARDRWADAELQFSAFLYGQQREDITLSRFLTRLDLANLLGALEYLEPRANPQMVIEFATSVETLMSALSLPRSLARALRVHEASVARLGGWSHGQFVGAGESVDRRLEEGRFHEAMEASRRLLAQTRAAGESAYEGAAYDLAMACFRSGRSFWLGGDAASALGLLGEARDRFQSLADAGEQNAIRMVSVVDVDMGDCLLRLGRVEESAQFLDDAIRRAEQLGDARQVAVARAQLGTVRMTEQKFDEARTAYEQALRIFEQLGELRMTAVLWQNLGLMAQTASQFDDAEAAYQAALQVGVVTADRLTESRALNALGILYLNIGRFEEAARFHQQAAVICRELNALADEGRTCANLANTLIQLGRYDEARQAILRAIECNAPFGHAAEPWKTFVILIDLEQAVGDVAAAHAARARAIQAYLAYRRDGGENLSGGGGIFTFVAQAIESGELAAAASQLAELEQALELPAYAKALLPRLQAILRGGRDPALADDPGLDYDDAAELQLLLEHLTRQADA